MMQTFADVIVAFGGYAKVAEALSCPAGTVSSWKSRNGIPPQYWSKLVSTATARGLPGVTLEVLAEIAARPVLPTLADTSFRSMSSELSIGRQLAAHIGGRSDITRFALDAMRICASEAPEIEEELGSSHIASLVETGTSIPATESFIARAIDRRLELYPEDRAAAEALNREDA